MSDAIEGLVLFISHSSRDSSVATALVRLVERALKLPAKSIRCTSIPGYRLPVGADTDEQLRREIFVARAFIGLLTPSSVDSAYVLFELGARWGAKRHLAPVFANGVDATLLRGPISGLNALSLSDRTQVLQLVEDLAEFLELPLEPSPSYQDAVNTLVAEASKVQTLPNERLEKLAAESELNPEETNLLELLAKQPQQTAEQLSERMTVPLERVNFYVERLGGLGLITYMPVRRVGMVWSLAQAGRAYLISRGLL